MKVLYIGGYSRSGSTMLLRVLGEATGVVAVGELIYIWERGYLQDQLCGCGQPFTVCDFWDEVSRRAFGVTSEEVPAARVAELQRTVHGYLGFAPLWVPVLRTDRYRQLLAEYTDVLARLYRAVAEVSGASLIVDSSKVPQYARLLSEVPTIELHLAHLVRDSRGTVWSWQRHKVRPEIHWTAQDMDRHSTLRSSVEWDAFNVLFGADRRRPRTYTLIRYEDLVQRPGPIMAALADTVGEPGVASQLRSTRDEVTLTVSHTVAGNPSRFSSGRTRISADEEWRSAMPPGQRLLVTAVTAPVLHRYGYPLAAVGSGPSPGGRSTEA